MTEEMQSDANKAIVLSKYMQGATNIFTVNETENAESGTTPPGPIDLYFEIPTEAVAINKVKLTYRNEAPRVWNTVTVQNSEYTQQVAAGGQQVPLSKAGNVWMDLCTVTSSDSSATFAWAQLEFIRIRADAALGNGSFGSLRFYDGTDYYPNSNGFIFISNVIGQHYHVEHDAFNTWYNDDASTWSRTEYATSTVMYPKSTSGKTVKLQIWAGAALTDPLSQVRACYGYQSVSTHTHDVGYDISTKTYTTTDIRIFTSDDTSSTPVWTERTAAIEAILGRSLIATEDAVENGLNDIGVDLTSFFSSTGWKGVRIVVNGNSRHKAQVMTKCYVHSRVT
jgi:hypothetical protein